MSFCFECRECGKRFWGLSIPMSCIHCSAIGGIAVVIDDGLGDEGEGKEVVYQ